MGHDAERERVDCWGCNGTGGVRPAHFGEREAPDTREREECPECGGVGFFTEEDAQ